MFDKKEARIRRATKSRAKMHELGVTRLVVTRTPRHIYAQIISNDNRVLASASTLDKDLVKDLKYTGNIEAAKVVGKAVAERALAAKVETVAFDRSGYQYHGRVAALADAAREAGLNILSISSIARVPPTVKKMIFRMLPPLRRKRSVTWSRHRRRVSPVAMMSPMSSVQPRVMLSLSYFISRPVITWSSIMRSQERKFMLRTLMPTRWQASSRG